MPKTRAGVQIQSQSRTKTKDLTYDPSLDESMTERQFPK